MPAIWDLPDFDSHEAVHVFDDRATGLKAVIAVHSTHLGPAAGGYGPKLWQRKTLACYRGLICQAGRLPVVGILYSGWLAPRPQQSGFVVRIGFATDARKRRPNVATGAVGI